MKKPGEFQKKRAERQRQAKIYQTLNEACKLAMEAGHATVDIDNKRYLLSNQPKYEFYTFEAFLRMKNLGIVFARINTKDSGMIEVIFPYHKVIYGIHSFVWDNIAAYVLGTETIQAEDTNVDKK